MNLGVAQVIPSGTSPSGKRTPNKVKFDDGTYATLAKGLSLTMFQVGMRGEATIATTQNGEYVNHEVTSWVPTIPPGQVPAQNFPTDAQKTAAKTDQAVWDAKDRAMLAMAQAKPAAEIVCALIANGEIKTLGEASAAWMGLSKSGYEFGLLARQDRVATVVNPLADEV